jgi:4-amino-4-deoxy-L-arabinose transferase-like glycosyltransferase
VEEAHFELKLRQDGFVLLCLLILGLGIRLVFFVGLSLGDDVFYLLQAISHARLLSWPPAPYHWQTRLGITIPTAIALKLFGEHALTAVLWPLVASLAMIPLSFVIARDFLSRRGALSVAVFQCCFPLDLIYATDLFPDLIVGAFSTISVWLWIRALRSENATTYFLSGAFIALGYLCRETVVLLAPVYLALFVMFRPRTKSPILWWVAVPLVMVIAECSLYGLTAGSPFYRWHAIAAQQHDVTNLQLISASTAGGGFWLDPLYMLAANQEFGPYQLVAAFLALYALIRWPVVKPIAVWWCAQFLWTYYGPTSIGHYVTLQRDPRYIAGLTVPALILIAFAISRLAMRNQFVITGFMITAGLISGSLDQGNSQLRAHRLFLQSGFARESALEPFEYVGARWELGLERVPEFACWSDGGRRSVVVAIGALQGAQWRSTAETKYIVFSPERRPDLLPTFSAKGWRVAGHLDSGVPLLRAAAAHLLKVIPSQRERAELALHPSGLIVLQNPNPVPRKVNDLASGSKMTPSAGRSN